MLNLCSYHTSQEAKFTSSTASTEQREQTGKINITVYT